MSKGGGNLKALKEPSEAKQKGHLLPGRSLWEPASAPRKTMSPHKRLAYTKVSTRTPRLYMRWNAREHYTKPSPLRSNSSTSHTTHLWHIFLLWGLSCVPRIGFHLMCCNKGEITGYMTFSRRWHSLATRTLTFCHDYVTVCLVKRCFSESWGAPDEVAMLKKWSIAAAPLGLPSEALIKKALHQVPPPPETAPETLDGLW